MPRLLPPLLIKELAICYLLQLYENENNFAKEWSKVRVYFSQQIEYWAKIDSVIAFRKWIINPSPYTGVVKRIQERTQFIDFIGELAFQNGRDLDRIVNELETLLVPYVADLNELAFRWNLRSSWAGDTLLKMDICRTGQQIFKDVSFSFLESQDEQLSEYVEGLEKEYSTFSINATIYSLFLSGGRSGYIGKVKQALRDYEYEIKSFGVIELPSALFKHADWWFEHYVHNIKFVEIADRTAVTKEGGIAPENIRKAIINFSKLIDISPEEPQ